MRKQVCEQGQSRMAICAGSEAQASDLWIRGNGGFDARHGHEWQCPLYVMGRK